MAEAVADPRRLVGLTTFEDLIGCRENHPMIVVFAVVLDHSRMGWHGALVAG